MCQDAEKRIKSSRRGYKDNHNRDVHNAAFSNIAVQHMYLERRAMTTFVAEPPATKSYNKLMTPKPGTLKVIAFSPAIITINEEVF